MYLLKTLSTRNDAVVAQNGIKIVNMWCSRPTSLKFKVFNTFWGDTDIQVKCTTGIAKFTKIAQSLYLLSYANHFEQTDLKDGQHLDFSGKRAVVQKDTLLLQV